MIESRLGKCGSCSHFDTRAVDGKPFGTRQVVSGAEEQLGVCRAPGRMGLLLGVRDTGASCVQPEGTFQQQPAKVIFRIDRR